MSEREIEAIEAVLRKHVRLNGGERLAEPYYSLIGFREADAAIAALRAQDREDGAREMRERAYEAVCSVRHAAACNFTPAFSGALGEARTNSLAEAARAVQALPLSPARKEDGDA